MVLKILLSIFILIAITLFVFFVLNILMPTVKKLTLQNTDPIFSPIELNYTKRLVDNNIKTSEYRAVVLAAPNKDGQVQRRMKYNGIKNCAIFEYTYGSLTNSSFDCIGFGDCAGVCPQQAIVIIDNIAQVTKDCCGCGLCMNSCPKKLIELLPKGQKSVQYKNDKNNVHIVEFPEKKGFQFWQDWYNILS